MLNRFKIFLILIFCISFLNTVFNNQVFAWWETKWEHSSCTSCEAPINSNSVYQLMNCWSDKNIFCIKDTKDSKTYLIVDMDDCKKNKDCIKEVDDSNLEFANRWNVLYQKTDDEIWLYVWFNLKSLWEEHISDITASQNPCNFKYSDIIKDHHDKFKQLFKIENVEWLIPNYECTVADKNDCGKYDQVCTFYTKRKRSLYYNFWSLKVVNKYFSYNYDSKSRKYDVSDNLFVYKDWTNEHVCFVDHDKQKIRYISSQEMKDNWIACKKFCDNETYTTIRPENWYNKLKDEIEGKDQKYVVFTSKSYKVGKPYKIFIPNYLEIRFFSNNWWWLVGNVYDDGHPDAKTISINLVDYWLSNKSPYESYGVSNKGGRWLYIFVSSSENSDSFYIKWNDWSGWIDGGAEASLDYIKFSSNEPKRYMCE